MGSSAGGPLLLPRWWLWFSQGVVCEDRGRWMNLRCVKEIDHELVVCYIIANYPQNLVTYNNKHLLSHSFYGSEIHESSSEYFKRLQSKCDWPVVTWNFDWGWRNHFQEDTGGLSEGLRSLPTTVQRLQFRASRISLSVFTAWQLTSSRIRDLRDIITKA